MQLTLGMRGKKIVIQGAGLDVETAVYVNGQRREDIHPEIHWDRERNSGICPTHGRRPHVTDPP